MINKDTKFFIKCEHPDCELEGAYRAPKNRDLKEYYRFCLKHISSYNKSWNYYNGMSIDEIEAENKGDETWHAKTWKFGVSLSSLAKEGKLKDPFEIYEKYMAGKKTANPTKVKVVNSLTKKERDSIKIFDIKYPFTENELKVKYKILVKKHHPDANKGSKESEEKFKSISVAYSILKKLET